MEEIPENELELDDTAIKKEQFEYTNEGNTFSEDDPLNVFASKHRKQIKSHISSTPKANSTQNEPIYEGKKIFQCAGCEASFTQKGNMERHYATVHEGKKPYKCKFCKLGFSQKVVLQGG